MQLARTQIGGHPGRVHDEYLADEDTVTGIGVGQLPPHSIDLVDFGLIPGVGLLEVLVLGPRHPAPALRMVTKLLVLVEAVGHVDPKAVHPPVEPEAQDLVEVLVHLGVAPVEVGLLRREQMEVVLAARLVERPCRPAEHRPPVVRGAAAGSGSSEEVLFPVGVRWIGKGILKPRMPVGGVIRNYVDDHLDASRVRLLQGPAGLLQSPKQRIDVVIVRDVVTVVGHG